MFTHPQLKLNIKNLLKFLNRVDEKKLKIKLAKFFPEKNIIFTDSGRSAFQLAIKELDLENSEMLIPAYICNSLLPIFSHYNIKPIYLDINLSTFNVEISEIEHKITPKTKSILVCHTYGLPNDMDKIMALVKKHNLKIIEDCAHLPPGLPRASKASRRGDCAFFSLPKFLPVINGGMLVCKNPIKINLKKCGFKISNLIKLVRLCPYLATFSEKFRQSYDKINKFTEPRKPFKCSLKIFDWHLDTFKKTLQKRTELAKYSQKELEKLGFGVQKSENNIFTYISALVPENINRDELFYKLRKKKVFCSRIWQKPIYHPLRQLADGGFPNTAEAAKRIINFPLQNWFKKKDVEKIIKKLKQVLSLFKTD